MKIKNYSIKIDNTDDPSCTTQLFVQFLLSRIFLLAPAKIICTRNNDKHRTVTAGIYLIIMWFWCRTARKQRKDLVMNNVSNQLSETFIATHINHHIMTIHHIVNSAQWTDKLACNRQRKLHSRALTSYM